MIGELETIADLVTQREWFVAQWACPFASKNHISPSEKTVSEVVKVKSYSKQEVLKCGNATEIEKHGKGYSRTRKTQIPSFIPSISSNFCALYV